MGNQPTKSKRPHNNNHDPPTGKTTSEPTEEDLVDYPSTTATATASYDHARNVLKSKIIELQRQFKEAEVQWKQLSDGVDDKDHPFPIPTLESTTSTSLVLPPPGKSGYLFKWQDRSIGWGGTKWALRFVSLDRGRISYYYSHLETISTPRYILSLRGCTIQDEGWKRNRKHKSSISSHHLRSGDPLEEVGAYFFVFSICHRPDDADATVNSSTSGSSDNSPTSAASGPGGGSNTTTSDTSFLVPLVRFSTPSLAEKTQWIQLLSEACAYCETEAFLQEEAQRNAKEEERRRQQAELAAAMPQATRGTLAPIYFAPTTTSSKKNNNLDDSFRKAGGGLVRRPSQSKLPKSSLYRVKSKSRDADKVEQRGYPPSKPMHRGSGPSFLSVEAKDPNYRGFFNLAMIILLISNFRLLVETFQHHGFVLADLAMEALDSYQKYKKAGVVNHKDGRYEYDTGFTAFFLGFGILSINVVIAYMIEFLLSRKIVPESVFNVLHHLNAHLSLLLPLGITWYYIDVPVIGATLLLTAVITWMKLISYVLANNDLRHCATVSGNNSNRSLNYNHIAAGDGHDDDGGGIEAHQATVALIDNLDADELDITYPRNVTLPNILYFWFAPTLTYQIAFPKSPRVRFLRVIGIILRMALVFSLFIFFVVQVVRPTLEHLLADLEATKGHYTMQILADYWLKLTVANTYLWLLVFYFYFHLFLNLLAECLRFGDRVFYKDWWNSVEVSAYWRLWNLPVHYWLVRHLYFPCVRQNISKMGATFIVFFFSAVIHEILVSIPFHMLRPWLFFGMMGQLPLIFISKFLYRMFPGSSIGNIIFWMSFCVVGQPMAIMMYTIDFYYFKLQHSSSTTIADDFLTNNATLVGDEL